MIADVYKLTPMQMGMFFHSLLDKKSTAYFEQFLFSLNGEIRPALLEKSFNRLIARYDILRTLFHIDKKDRPIQIVLKQRQCKIHSEDITHLNQDEQARYIKDFLARDKEKGFDLTRDILMRLSLLRTGPNTRQLVWSFHHILMDGWCLGIIFKELIGIYHSLQKGEPLKLEPVTPYAQYIKWLEQQDKEKGLEYWREYLQGYEEPAGMEKFGKRETSEKQEYKVEIHRFAMEEAVTAGLKRTAAENNATVNTVFQAIWGILQQRYNNTADVVYGAVVSGRPPGLPGIENMVGLFINTVPVRVTSTGDQTFSQLVRDLQVKAVEAKSYEYLPLAEIQAQTPLKNQLIDHIVAFENYPVEQQIKNNNAETETRTGLSVKNVNAFEQTGYHFNILVSPGKRLSITFNFNSCHLEPSFVKQTAAHLMEMAHQVAVNPGIPGKAIEIITPTEKHQLLTQFNETQREYPKDKTLHEYFKEQEKQIPDHIALLGENPGQRERHLTYGELEKKSAQLARRLQEKGIQADSIVALKIERSLEMIIAILGILKAGGAYLPIDPGNPEERVNYMLADSSVRVLLTTPKLQEKAGEEKNCKQPLQLPLEFVNLETGHAEVFEPSPSTLTSTCQVSPANLAYVIYTSGTTGKPKGNLITHANVIRVVKETNYIELTDRDRVLQLSNYAFDGSVFDIYGALVNGAVLVLINRDRLLALEQLAAFITRRQITVFFVTTALFNALVETRLHCLAQVRKILFGGERVSPGHCRKALEYMGKNRLLHMYGPTETTVYATYYEINQIQKEAENIPIGKPIINTAAYILDLYRHLVPIGITGQLYIGGEGLARGYLNKPGLTAEKFNHDLWDWQDYQDDAGPFGRILNTFGEKNKNTPGKPNNMPNRSSLYQTGDLARWLWDGNIEFIGRVDTQVKIRGFRIEPAEIENQLKKHPQVKEAVVLVREEETGNKFLCAYLISRLPGTTISPSPREFLSRELPDYMIPTYFVPLETFPLNQSGKIDRKALPAPKIEKSEKYTEPRDIVEKKLVEIWAGILKVEKEIIGIDSNFFELGGHSLKVTTLVSRIHKNLNVKITLARVFKTPTIRGLAPHIRNAEKEKHAAILPVEKKDYYNLSSPQKRLYVLQQIQENNIGYNMPRALPLTFTGENLKEKLQLALQKLIARHESLRTSFHMMEDEPVQKIHDRVEFEIEHKEIEENTGERKIEEKEAPIGRVLDAIGGRCPKNQELSAKSCIYSFTRPFDLSQAPLLRVGLVGFPPGGLLLIDMHHIITDGASQAILNEEINRLYEGKTLPLLKLQYKDYAQWQNSKEQQTRIAQQKNYWINMLSAAGEIPVLNLPIDHPRPINQDFSGNTIGFVIEETGTANLEKIAEKAGATLYMTVLSVFYLLLAKLSSQEDIIIGTPVAARRHTDLERIIGMFVNTLAPRNYPSGEKTFTGFLQEVKKHTLQAFENQEYQFEELVENLSVPRDTGRNPVFDVMFNWLNLADYQNSQTGPAREISTQHLNQHKKSVSKFDLTLTAVQLEEKLLFFVEYCTKLFQPRTIDRIIEYFRKIVDLLPLDPDQRISGIEIITTAERRQVLYEFNDTRRPFPANRNIQQLFAQQVERTPDQIALVGPHESRFEGTRGLAPLPGAPVSAPISITYRQLNQESQQLALLLKERGIKPGTIVGIMLERSIDMIIGILAILTAGGAYLPIDPEFPEERIKYILKDSNASILLATEDTGNTGGVASYLSTLSTLLPFSSSTLASPPPSPLPLFSPSLPSGPVYVIYTSGTTGNPKGVMIRHVSLVNFVYSMYKDYSRDFGPADNCLSLTNFCFDVSVCEIFLPLVFGAGIVLFPYGKLFDPRALARTIVKDSITFTYIPPGLLKDVYRHLRLYGPGMPPELNKLLVGVEPIQDDVLEDYLSLNPSMQIVNGYGPTEATICAAAYRYRSHRPEGKRVPIGRPLANTQILLLDKTNHPAPVGIPGEICISGIGLARGYLNRPGLTAEKFDHDLWDYRDYRDYRDKRKKVPDERIHYVLNRSYKSYMSYISKRIYKTGDQARWLSDGNIEFLGRIDHQVKIRGFRIELGEIENRLLKHNKIHEAVVISKEDHNREKYLCAYFVSNRDLPVTELREYLSKFMPDYMIPAYFVQLRKIPLTANGKIDRKALPQPAIKAKENYTAPRDVIEKQLAEIWYEILCRNASYESPAHTSPAHTSPAPASQIHESIGIDDNFFEIGGHSLKATAMTAKIQKQFQVDLSLAQVFNTPTIRQLAGYIKTRGKEIAITTDHHLVLIKKGKTGPNHLFFIHDGTGEVEAYIEFCNFLDSGYNCWGIKARGFENYTPQNIAIEDLAQKYIQVLQQVQISPPYRLSGWSLGGIIAFEMVRQLERQDQKVDFFALIDAPVPNRDLLKPPVEFSLEHELDFVKKYLPADIYEKVQAASQSTQLWQLVVQQLESKNVEIKEIKNILTQLGGQGISNVEHMNIPESIRYLNILRSFARARGHYVPGEKINTPIHYFKAVQSKQIKHEEWKDYSLQPTAFYEIPGDHYSIFRSPPVTDFAKTFAKILEESKQKISHQGAGALKKSPGKNSFYKKSVVS